METTELNPRQTPTGNGSTTARLARKRFDPTHFSPSVIVCRGSGFSWPSP